MKIIPKLQRVPGFSSKKIHLSGIVLFLKRALTSIVMLMGRIVSWLKTPKCKKVISISLILLAVIIFIVEVTFGVLIYGFKNNSQVTQYVARVVPYPIAIVGFQSVTVADYNFEYNYIQHFYNQAQREIPETMNQQIIDQLTENKILEREAPKYSTFVSSSDIDKTVNELIDQNGGQEQVEQVLQSYYGLTLKEFRKLVRSQLLLVKMKDTVPVQIHASHILIKADAAADAKTVEDAKNKALGVITDLKGGVDFAEEAKKMSDDTGSRDQGGDLGWFAMGDMVKPFEEVAFTLDLNQISDPVKTDYGWHVIKVLEKRGAEKMSFDDWMASQRSASFIRQLVLL